MALIRIASSLLLIGVLGCATVQGTLPEPTAPQAKRELRAGAATRDITPPPGFAMAGHGVDGEVAIGVWTRLRVRALVFEDRAGVPLVLAVADLWSIPGGLTDRVAQLVGERSELSHVGREHVVLAATHTHQGPGGYSSARVYNRHASARPGFDPDLFDFLATRIADAIVDAAGRLRPARITRHAIVVPGVARNRSLPAFLSNEGALDLVERNANLPGCRPGPRPRKGDVDACHAVDPLFEALRVVDAEHPGDVIAVAGFFAVHPTAMPSHTSVYNGDLFAIAAHRAEAQLRVDDRDESVVVAMFNGAQGDVAPNWLRQGRAETSLLGSALADGLVEALSVDGTPVAGTLGFSFSRVDVASGRRATPGRRRDPALPSPILARVALKTAYPRSVPVGVYTLGSTSVVTLPGEFTTMMGEAARRDVAAALGTQSRVLTIGLAGEYLSHFTTPSEYAVQHREGGSTLYGEQSGATLVKGAAEIAKSNRLAIERSYRYKPGPRERYSPTLVKRESEGAFERVTNQLEALPRSRFVTVAFVDSPPRWPVRTPADPTTPRVSAQIADGGAWKPLMARGVPISDEGGAFATVVTAVERAEWQYATIWLTPGGSPPGARLRLRIATLGRGEQCSSAFTLAELYGGALELPLPTTSC